MIVQTPIIGSDHVWGLWAVITIAVALSLYLEQKYAWAAKISGCVLALVIAVALSNLNIIPTKAGVYDIIWDYAVPLAIPLLLFQCDLKRIWKESGRMLLIFLISSVGTVAGAIVAFMAFQKYIPELAAIAGMMTGSYIGGTVNLVAISNSFQVSEDMLTSTLIADNLLMALYFFVLIAIPGIAFFRKHFKHPYVKQVEKEGGVKNQESAAKEYWAGKEITLKDIAYACGTSFFIVAVSILISDFCADKIPATNEVLKMINMLLGNQYFYITTITMILATIAPKFIGNIKGSQEIGTYLIYLFFFVIGAPASIPLIIKNSPLLLIFCAIMVLINMIVSFAGGKLFKFSMEEIILASNANIGGPTTAMAMAISKGWKELIVPAMLVGIFGYVIGNYVGLFIGNLLM